MNDSSVQQKYCNHCQRWKLIGDFYNRTNRLDGRGKDSLCKVCRNAAKAAHLRSPVGRAKAVAARKKRHREHPEIARAKKQKEYQSEAHKKHWPIVLIQKHGTRLKMYYKITAKEYEDILRSQDGLCAICRTPPGVRRLHVDHDHQCCPEKRTCGECIRGLLCGSCNRALGFLHDSPERADRAGIYLRRHAQLKLVV